MEECEFVFKTICVSETWCSNTKLQNNSIFSDMGFDSVPYKISETGRWDGVLIFIKKNLSYKIRKDFSESDEHKETISLEISNRNSSNTLLSCCCKPTNGDHYILSMFLKQVLKNSTAENKPYYLIGDPNILLRIFWKQENLNILQFNIWIWCNRFNK